jgi:CDP-diacylglycerol--glycerol-3-phosphate 3-phosphatidyltransferase
MTRSALAWLPNAVTVLRGVAGVAGAWLLLASAASATEDRAIALGLASGAVFVIAALTDWLDGWLARRMGAESALGALLDPIADKVLVGAYLIAFTIISEVNPWLAVPVMLIIGRDVLMTGIRLTSLEADPNPVPVSAEAKFKTAIQMIIVAMPFVMTILGVDIELWFFIWVGGVWFAAVLGATTAWGYFRRRG